MLLGPLNAEAASVGGLYHFDIESGMPGHISTSYVERQNLTLRMTQKRFARLTNGFSKKQDHHAAAVSPYVARYDLCRVHEALRTMPAVALGIAETRADYR